MVYADNSPRNWRSIQGDNNSSVPKNCTDCSFVLYSSCNNRAWGNCRCSGGTCFRYTFTAFYSMHIFAVL